MNDENKQVTVAELVEQLKQLPQDLLVETEGCDCLGPCCGARLNADSMMVVLERGR